MKKQTVSEYECLKCKRRVNFYSDKNDFYTHCKICGSELKYCWTHPYNPDSSLKTINNYNKIKLSQNKRKQDINPLPNQPKCPKCGCTNIQVVRRNWSFFRGLTTNKTDRVCANCNYKW